MSKGAKIGIIAVLLIVAAVVIYFITQSSTPAVSAPSASGAGAGTGTENWQIIPGITQEQTNAFCNHPDLKPEAKQLSCKPA